MSAYRDKQAGISLLDAAMAFAVCSLLVSFTVPSWFHKTVRRVLLGADCAEQKMAVVLWTAATAAGIDPVLEWTTEGIGPDISWRCRVVLGDPRHVPGECRHPNETG